MSSLLPTPAKSHYTFNLRDLAKVFQGTLMGSPKYIEKPIGMVRLWSHELKRVFEDRLTTSDDHDWFVSQLTECVSSKFGMKWADIVRTERADSASRRVEAPSRHRRDSCPSHDEVSRPFGPRRDPVSPRNGSKSQKKRPTSS